jgi:hypothetical protein
MFTGISNQLICSARHVAIVRAGWRNLRDTTAAFLPSLVLVLVVVYRG